MRNLLLNFVFLLLYMPLAYAQGTGSTAAEEQKHLVYFTDKSNTPFSLNQPEAFLSAKALERRQRQLISLTARDLPVDPAYVAGLQALNVQVWYTSRWFNAAVVQCSDEKLQEIEALPFVKSARRLNRLAQSAGQTAASTEEEKLVPLQQQKANAALAAEDYGLSFHQANMLGANTLHEAGYTGAGMTIAVFDAGFPAVDTLTAFSHLFQENQIRGTFDFVQKQPGVYGANSHGTSVLSTMAAYAPGQIIGTAYAANYLLLRTEDVATEHNIEEINWLLAAEYADSAGADVINSSVGYTTFDSPSVSYAYEELDGNTTLVARAADMAAATGMLVVVSAGNEGDKTWHYIGTPADADSVLAVGAVDSLGVRARFSSFGPTADGQVKPDVVALGQRAYVLDTKGNVVQGFGTSFSGPIIAGFATCLWQANSSKTNMQLIQLLRQSGSNAASPNNEIGYGIPSYSQTITGLPALPLNSTAYITNPVQDRPIVLTLGQEWWQLPVVVQLMDPTGKILFRQSIAVAQREQVLALAPQQLASGIYLCRLRSGSRVLTIRFVKL